MIAPKLRTMMIFFRTEKNRNHLSIIINSSRENIYSLYQSLFPCTLAKAYIKKYWPENIRHVYLAIITYELRITFFVKKTIAKNHVFPYNFFPPWRFDRKERNRRFSTASHHRLPVGVTKEVKRKF